MSAQSTVSRDKKVDPVGVRDVIVNEPNQIRKRKLATESNSVPRASGKRVNEARTLVLKNVLAIIVEQAWKISIVPILIAIRLTFKIFLFLNLSDYLY